MRTNSLNGRTSLLAAAIAATVAVAMSEGHFSVDDSLVGFILTLIAYDLKDFIKQEGTHIKLLWSGILSFGIICFFGFIIEYQGRNYQDWHTTATSVIPLEDQLFAIIWVVITTFSYLYISLTSEQKNT